MSEVEERMIIEVKRQRQQAVSQSQWTESSFNPEQFGLNLKSLAALKDAVFEAPIMDCLRVEQIKRELASGSYEISNDAIAVKLLAG